MCKRLMFEILRDFFLMMNPRKKMLEKEARLGTSQEAGEDGVMKMWIEMVSDILCGKSNKLLSPVNTLVIIIQFMSWYDLPDVGHNLPWLLKSLPRFTFSLLWLQFLKLIGWAARHSLMVIRCIISCFQGTVVQWICGRWQHMSRL